VRRIIENAWGVYKKRFQCAQRTLRIRSPTEAGRILKACAILHNFAIANKENDRFLPEEFEDFPMEDDNEMEDDCNENALINNRLLQLNNSFLIVNNLQ